MGTITSRQRTDGTIGYTAQIRLKRKGVIVHTEAQTFDRKANAVSWLKKRETQLAVPGAIERAGQNDPTLGEAIDRYMTESGKTVGKTKTHVLRAIKTYGISATRCSKIGSEEIVAYVQELKVQPQTAANYLAQLTSVFAIAKPAWGYPLDRQAMRDAFEVTNRLGLTGKSKERDRRPSLDELDRIMNHYVAVKRTRPDSLTMLPIVAFALFSTRRLDEICRILWADLDVKHSRVLVRDMKNPGEKEGNDVWCDLPTEALLIAQSMPKATDCIFPLNKGSIGSSWQRATEYLKIDDLHFHDLRHEGISRLFEMGLTIPQVATVSGHRSWQSLKRYAHIRQSGDKFAGWKWLATLTGK